MRSTVHWLTQHHPEHLVLVCSGTGEQHALEDMLAAGALCEKIWSNYSYGRTSDAAELVRRVYPLLGSNLLEAMKSTRNGNRLLAQEDLRDDVWYCVQREIFNFAAELCPDGAIRKIEE